LNDEVGQVISTSADAATAVPAGIATEILDSAPADYGVVAVPAYLRSAQLIRFFDPINRRLGRLAQSCRAPAAACVSGGLSDQSGLVTSKAWRFRGSLMQAGRLAHGEPSSVAVGRLKPR
jgi:hypothetical protein